MGEKGSVGGGAQCEGGAEGGQLSPGQVCRAACARCCEEPGAKRCFMQDRGQLARGGTQGQHPSTKRQGALPSSRADHRSVLNPSGAFVPGPGKCGGEGGQRRRGGHECTPPNLEVERETGLGKQKNKCIPTSQPAAHRSPTAW